MYGKLFSSLDHGTLRGQAHEILVFSNMIAHADKDGYVDKHWRAIAEECGLSIEEVKTACQNLEAPDAESRSKEADGARIVRVDDHRAWGWKITNYAKYRAIRSEEDRRCQNREAKRREREKSAMSATVSQGSASSAQAEGEAEAEEYNSLSARAREAALPGAEPVMPTVQEVIEFAAMRGIPSDYARDYWAKKNEKHGWIANGKLIVWQSELPRWHSKDRTTPSVGKTTKFPKRTQAELEADL